MSRERERREWKHKEENAVREMKVDIEYGRNE